MKLNKQQKQASQPHDGISLVLAGPGTGKTKTLVEKVKNLLLTGKYKANEVLVLTFSKKAAQEMKDRIMSSIKNKHEKLLCTTFHSFCYKFLLTNKVIFLQETGYKKFPQVIESEKKDSVMYKIIHQYMEDFLGLSVKTIIELISNKQLFQKHRKQLKKMKIDKLLEKVKADYNKYKTENNFIEYEDMINITINLLNTNNQLKQKINNQFKYIIVDEYQDTSKNNFELINLLINRQKPNLYVTGDDRQNIFSFRGTDLSYIVKFKKYFKRINKTVLKYNYRSNKEIVKISSKFIKKNKFQTSKKQKSVKGKGGLVKGHIVSEYKEEMKQLKVIIENELTKTNDIAILYRNNFQGNDIKRIFKDNNLHNYLQKLKLMTMHSSKGLEFDSVIITGINDKIIPSSNTNIEEERRLMYVAMTRAKSRLNIIYYNNEYKGKAKFAQELGF